MSLIYTAPIAQSQKSAFASTSLKRRNSIYIGGKADAKSRAKLEQWRVSHILNMTPQKDSSVQVSLPFMLFIMNVYPPAVLFEMDMIHA
jgi:hypothetical protein